MPKSEPLVEAFKLLMQHAPHPETAEQLANAAQHYAHAYDWTPHECAQVVDAGVERQKELPERARA